jgi:hypothetical protein
VNSLLIGKNWKKKYQPSLLSQQRECTLSPAEQKAERNKAYDLLDTLTRSGIYKHNN